MRIAVLGLWHLGSVTTACLAAAGHDVIGWDPDREAVEALSRGNPPVAEPGLRDLIEAGRQATRLRFVSDVRAAVENADVVWIAFDTPVDADDRGDIESVVRHVDAALTYVPNTALVLASSQWPVGTTRQIEALAAERRPGAAPNFAYSPENLRLGNAVERFQRPDRVIAGVRNRHGRQMVERVWSPITNRIEFMSVESAEMTKHAINAFLGASVSFINELAALCEQVGADAREVERGLKTERRIGPLAYLSPGAAFAGGTLARDVEFLRQLGRSVGRETPLLDGIAASNRAHRGWARRRLETVLGPLAGKRIAVWGLTYKAGTDTLRRSGAVDLCDWLSTQGADVHVHDPAVGALPSDLAARVTRHSEPLDATRGAHALVVATEWPVYRQVSRDALAESMRTGVIIDANRFLDDTIAADERFRLVSVGQPSS